MNRVSAQLESGLSDREKTVARLLAWGYTQKEIAARPVMRVARATRARRYENVFELHLALTA